MVKTDIFIKPKSHFHLDHHSQNIFTKLRAQGSILMNLYAHNQEILNIGAQAPSPSKNYCQLILTLDTVIYRAWQISLHSNSESRYPTENVSSYEDLVHDDILQREISRVFGKNTLNYILNIVEKGKVDYIVRLPENILLKIISFLPLEDISRLSQVNCMFRQICRSDKVWVDLYKQYYSDMITDELYALAARDGWRKLFFTNKIKLKLELRRHAKTNKRQAHRHDLILEKEQTSIYSIPKRIDGVEPGQRRATKSAFKRSTDNLNSQNESYMSGNKSLDKFRSHGQINRIPGDFLRHSEN